jgi:hypothetical protein
MSETRKTLLFGAAAIVLVLITVLSAPKQVTPDAFSDLGESFFPEFTDPNAATTLEVIEFDEQTGEAKPFKVTFSDGRWTIPSHYSYPADGQDRLARTAAGLIGITKDDFRTDNVADHAACGVIDPLDETVVELAGRGKRVTVKSDNGLVLADLIVGRSYEDREGFHLVRVPGQKRVYGSLMDLDISTKFADWIEADLLKVEKDKISRIVLKDYSIDERTGRLNQRDELAIWKEMDDSWSAAGIGEDKEVDKYKMGNLTRALDELTIVGVRPKPAGLTASLTQSAEGISINTSDMLSLQSKGYYFAKDGRLLSNEGELQATTSGGVVYTLRFGEVVYGTGEAVSAGTGDAGGATGPGENRYLFITTSFNPDMFPEPDKPAHTDFLEKPDSLWTPDDYQMKSLQVAHDSWESDLEAGRQLSEELNARFANWYYVISAESFDKVHLTRADVLKDKPETN